MSARTVLYIVSALRRCGPIRQLFNLIKYLDHRQFLPVVKTLSVEPKDSLMDEFIRMEVAVSSLRLSRFESFLHARRLISDYISKHAPDIIHSSGFRADLFSGWFNRRVHTVATVRNYPFEDYAYNFGWLGRHLMAPLHLRILRRIEKPVLVSRSLSERLLQEHGIAFDFVQNGADQDTFFPVADEQKRQIRSQLGLPPEHRLFIVVGHLSPRKDPLCVAQGFLRAAIPNATMIFAGDGILREKLNLLCNSENIIFIGKAADVRLYLQASDFLVSGAHSEGLPNAVLEAMACGLPCILSDIPSHREILGYEPQAGIFFSAGNAEQLAETLRRITEQPYDARQQAALWIIKNHLNAQQMSRQYQALYEKLLRT